MNSEREATTLNRILSLEWQGGDLSRQTSQLALFGEYLRRFGRWCHRLEWWEAHPVASDLPGQLVTDDQAAPVNTTLMQQTLRTLGETTVYERMLLTRVLNWAAIADDETVLRYQLPDPYEPLLMFFERGGWLDKAQGDSAWKVSGRVERLNKAWTYHDLDAVPLDDPAYFNALDENASA